MGRQGEKMYKYGTDYILHEACNMAHVAVCRYTRHRVVITTTKLISQLTEDSAVLGARKVQENHTSHIQGYSKVPPGFPNSTAQQPRQTRQKGAYQ